jgi:hypothetical protein
MRDTLPSILLSVQFRALFGWVLCDDRADREIALFNAGLLDGAGMPHHLNDA